MLSYRGSFQPRDWTQVSHIAGGFFTIWATREAQEYWSGWSVPSPGDLPYPGIKPGTPALPEDSLPVELPGKPILQHASFTKYLLKISISLNIHDLMDLNRLNGFNEYYLVFIHLLSAYLRFTRHCGKYQSYKGYKAWDLLLKVVLWPLNVFSSLYEVSVSHSVMSDSLKLHGL